MSSSNSSFQTPKKNNPKTPSTTAGKTPSTKGKSSSTKNLKSSTSLSEEGPPKRALDGSIVLRPPPDPRNINMTKKELDDFVTKTGLEFRGKNFQPYHTVPEPEGVYRCKILKENFKKGLRPGKCYDNVSSFGGESWTTTGAEIGQIWDFKLLARNAHPQLPAPALLRKQLDEITRRENGEDIEVTRC